MEKDGGNGVGPNLFGIAGRKAATVDGFNYSGPMKAAGITWTDDNLAKWVAGPAKMVPGTKMAFAWHHQQRPDRRCRRLSGHSEISLDLCARMTQ